MNKKCANCRYKNKDCITTLCIPDDHKYWEPERVYISGPITGVQNFRETFEAAAQKLQKQGYDPVNPCDGEEDGHTWEYYMKKDIKKLMDCDRILLLPGWEDSKGAQLEAELAKTVGIQELEEY